MKIKNLQFTSPTALNFDLDITSQICLFRGKHSALVLDLIRELIGDYSSENDPDEFDDGRFVISSDVEMDGKNYDVCYIRNADYIGDNRIAANFVLNTFDFSRDDTKEFIDKCNLRDKDGNNVICHHKVVCVSPDDDRPLFVYCEDADDISHVLIYLSSLDRQAFVAMKESGTVTEKGDVQTFLVG